MLPARLVVKEHAEQDDACADDLGNGDEPGDDAPVVALSFDQAVDHAE